MSAIELGPIVEALWEQNLGVFSGRVERMGRHRLPSKSALLEVMERLRAAMFPAHFGAGDLTREAGRYYVGATLDAAMQLLEDQIHRVLVYVSGCEAEAACERRAREMTRAFAVLLPEIRRQLATDVQAAFDGDPAAMSIDETLFCYPGIQALVHHRVAHALYRLQLPLLPRIISEASHSQTGIDIHPGAQIGDSFFIDHGTGVVIGETTVIGKRVRLYQGVTLGAKSFPVDAQGQIIKGSPRHPIVEDDVVIYAGATILGRITIGAGSSIGGNVWLTRSVPSNSRITQAQSRVESYSDGAGI